MRFYCFSCKQKTTVINEEFECIECVHCKEGFVKKIESDDDSSMDVDDDDEDSEDSISADSMDDDDDEDSTESIDDDENENENSGGSLSIEIEIEGVDVEELSSESESSSFGDSEISRSLTENELKKLPQVLVTKEQKENGMQCATCLDQYSLGERVAILNCKHMFHINCIKPWLKRQNTCPSCRMSVEPEDWPTTSKPTSSKNSPSKPTTSKSTTSKTTISKKGCGIS